jgi:hypothetical protein
LLNELIGKIADQPPRAALLRKAAAQRSISLDALLDEVARHIAESYLGAKYTWDYADKAMNNLYNAAYVLDDFCLPNYAMQVYLAFDEGEYKHMDSRDLDGEPRTKAILNSIEPDHPLP